LVPQCAAVLIALMVIHERDGPVDDRSTGIPVTRLDHGADRLIRQSSNRSDAKLPIVAVERSDHDRVGRDHSADGFEQRR
jgi:3'-phosphoadenosine 5'-phosphosulfate (PAPS) 3'-phosphatase